MFSRKLLIVALVCSAPSGAETLPESAPENGSNEIRAAAQFLSQYRNQLDCENLGHIQTGEADEHSGSIFLSLDIDSSRSISRSELMNIPFVKNRSLLAVAFSKMDQNGDGKLTEDELRIYLNDAVTIIDGNNDGYVYPIEIEHALNTGTIIKSAVASTNRKKNKQSDFVPPWSRHKHAVDKVQTAEPSTSSTHKH